MSATLATYDATLAELWPQQRVENLAADDFPTLGIIGKQTNFDEKIKHIAIQSANNQGRSAKFATAQANSGSASFGEWQITKVSDYGIGGLDGELLESTRTKHASLVNSLDNEMKGTFTELKRSLHLGFFGDGTGTRGQMDGTAGAPATDTIMVADVEDIGKFSVGMWITAAATTTGVIRAGRAKITAIDRDIGTLTVATTWDAAAPAGIPTLGVSDYLFQEGDAPNNTGVLTKVAGFAGWLPKVAPTAGDNWFGKDRSVDPVTFAGIRYSATGAGSIKEALQLAGARVAREGNGAEPDTAILSSLDFAKLGIELGSQETRPVNAIGVNGKRIGTIGYDGYVIHTSAGPMVALCDYVCPEGTCYMLTRSSWKFGSLGGVPKLSDFDGLKIRAKANEDGFEFRALYRGQLWCDAPGWNAVVTLPA